MYSFSIACPASELKKALKKITQFQIVEKTMNNENDQELEELRKLLNKEL
jgi:hypothetical protein